MKLQGVPVTCSDVMVFGAVIRQIISTGLHVHGELDTREINKYVFFCAQDDVLWACLAAMASYAKDLATAEVAYAAICEVR